MENKNWITIPSAMQLLSIKSRTTLGIQAHHIRVSRLAGGGKVYISHNDTMTVLSNNAVPLGCKLEG